jgi:hypothetical protein
MASGDLRSPLAASSLSGPPISKNGYQQVATTLVAENERSKSYSAKIDRISGLELIKRCRLCSAAQVALSNNLCLLGRSRQSLSRRRSAERIHVARRSPRRTLKNDAMRSVPQAGIQSLLKRINQSVNKPSLHFPAPIESITPDER